MNTLTLLKRNYEEISTRAARIIREHHTFLVKEGIANIHEPPTKEVWSRLWNKFIDSADPLVKKFERDLKPLFTRQGAEVLANMKAHPLPESARVPKQAITHLWKADAPKPLTATQERFIETWLFDKKKWVKEFQGAEAPHIAGSIISGGAATMEALPGAATFDATEATIVSFVKTRALKSSLDVNKTTAALLRNSITKGIQAGEATGDIAKRVRTITQFNDKVRSRRIAQTETIGAVNKGSLEGSKQSGVVEGNQWLASLDDLVRETHEELTTSGEMAKLGEEFSNGLEYPGDQGGDAAEVINCRCSLLPVIKK